MIDAGGRLVTLRNNSTANPVLISDASAGTIATPTFSPNGARIAWGTSSPLESNVTTASTSVPASRERASVGSVPFYLAWSNHRGGPSTAPSSLTLLRAPGENQLQLSEVTTTAGTSEQLLAQNQTVYYSVSPNGARAIAHVGRDDLVLVDLTRNTSTKLAFTAGAFRTPVWLNDSEALVALRATSEPGQPGTTTPAAPTTQHFLSRIDVDRGSRVDVLRFEGSIDFVLEKQNRRLVAYQVTGGGGSGRNPAFAPLPQQPTTTLRQAPLASIGRLSILDLTSGQTRPIIELGALAFMWSPRADRLAYLSPRGENQVQWQFWSDATIESSVVFAPGDWTRTYVAGFTQFAESMQFFSPDGNGFVFTGRVSDQESVFVQVFDQRVQAVAPARLINGSFGVWSPA